MQGKKENGFITKTDEDGDTYKGMMVDGKKEGQGIMNWADGGIYEGAWHNDLRHGEGTSKWADGNTYRG